MSVIVDDKTSHLRMLVVKQKSNVKRKNKSCSSINNISGNYTKYNRNESPHKNNFYNNRSSGNNKYNNCYDNYQHSNTKNNNYKLRFNSNLNNNNNDQLTSSYTKNNSNLNINQDNSGYVTDALQDYLKKYISKNQKVTFILSSNFF